MLIGTYTLFTCAEIVRPAVFRVSDNGNKIQTYLIEWFENKSRTF